MNSKETQLSQMLTHVVDFGTSIVGMFPETSGAAKLLAALKSGVTALSEEKSIYGESQTAMRVGLAAKNGSLENLKSYLSRAAQLSRALHTDQLRLPANPTSQALIDCGKAFLRGADSMKKDFVEYGFSANFAEELGAAIEDLELKIQDYRKAKGQRSASAKKWRDTLAEALDVLGRFDCLVNNALADDPGVLESYSIARQVRRVGARKTVGTTTPAAEPAPASATTTATAA